MFCCISEFEITHFRQEDMSIEEETAKTTFHFIPLLELHQDRAEMTRSQMKESSDLGGGHHGEG